MAGTTHTVLPAQLRSIPAARRLLRELLQQVGAEDLWDRAGLAVSELVTNAVVHAGSEPDLRIVASNTGIRVEVGDTSAHLPTPRDFPLAAGSGRGLRLVDHSVDRWGATPTATGKTVWFEIGDPPATSAQAEPAGPPAPATTLTVRLLDVPLLMHWAWQEHAQSLLREYLLFASEHDAGVVQRHAEASGALAVLQEQIPRPQLPDDPDALLADTLEPGVTAPALDVRVPAASVAHFASLELVLSRAVEAADAGLLLGPPTQPEISEMREWFCDEISRQAAGHDGPRPWRARTDVRAKVDGPSPLDRGLAEVTGGPADVLVTDASSVIVGVSPSVTAFLGYADAADLLGRRVIAVVPQRYHQAHIAGTTLNATNGRDKLLGVWLTVPVVRADGTEVTVGLRVTPRLLGGTRVFVAEMDLAPAP